MKTFLIAVLLIICTNSFAQLATYDWSNRIGTTSTAKKSLIDGSGNIYVWVTAVAPITIGSTTYTNTAYDNYLVKYNNAGNIIWSKEIRIRMFNMCLTKDSSSVLVCGFLQSNYTSFDLGNSVTTGTAYYSSGIIYKVDGSTGNSLWVKDYDATLPVLSSATRIDAIYETNKGIFCIQGLKIRRLNFDGIEIWNRIITQNGTAYSIENKNFNSWADDNGNSFYTGVSDNGNATSITLNAISYTTFGNNNVCRVYFSLDSSGNTNWVNTNVNFQPGKNVEVSKSGFVIVGGSHIYNNMGGESNHPFVRNYCPRDYNVFKANLKTCKSIWSSYSTIMGNINAAGFHLGNDDNTYISCLIQITGAGENLAVATSSRYFVPISSAPNNYILRINNNGVPDSVFSVNTFGSSSMGDANFKPVNLFRTNQGKFVYLLNQKNASMNFSNGNANTNTSTTLYQNLVQFTAPNMQAAQKTKWTGNANGNWFDAGNWTNGIPSDTAIVTIPQNATTYPTSVNQFYNFSTSKWPKCGGLIIEPNVDYRIVAGTQLTVAGMFINDGKIANPYLKYNTVSNIIGNGEIHVSSANGGQYWLYRTGNNTVVLTMDDNNSSIFATTCIAVKRLVIVKGNIDFSSTTTQYLYVDSGIVSSPPSKIYPGSITSRAIPNVPVSFPIGNATNVQPASVTIQNTTQDVFLTASFSSTVTGTAPNPATCIVNGLGIASTLNGGMWTITAATALQSGAYYTTNFKLNGSTNAISANRYALLKRDNSSSNWQVAGTYQPAMDSASYVVSSATNISSFSDFAIGIANGVLPIQSIKLSVVKANNNNKLSWNIIATDADKIEIQKSNNGYSFSVLNAQSFVASGFYADAFVVGKNYYRLKVTDKNDNYSYSNIVVIDDKATIDVQVYPTVFNQSFTIQNNSAKNLQLQVTDVAGKQLLKQILLQRTNIIDAKQISTGIVFYKIINENTTISSGKIIKQ